MGVGVVDGVSEDVGDVVTAAVPVGVPVGVDPLLPVIEAVRDGVFVGVGVGVGVFGAQNTLTIAFLTRPLQASGRPDVVTVQFCLPTQLVATDAGVIVVPEQVETVV